MVEIREEILNKYGIYKTRKLKEHEEEMLLKIKNEIEKIINIPIERVYIINEAAWGKEPEKAQYSICILVDKRLKDIREKRELVNKYAENKKIGILFWTLCQFEKTKNVSTEDEYYIYRYGIKVYDSGKKTEINENVKVSQYAVHMSNIRAYNSYMHATPDYWMNEMVKAYTLKIGYALVERYADLKKNCDFAKLVSKDKKAIEIIDRYLEQKEKIDKNKVLDEFKEHLNNTKQVKFQMKLEEKPTMKVYEKLLKQKEKQGVLDLNTLTRDDFYTMYVIQGIYIDLIAELYGVDNKKISSKKNNWKIIRREAAFIDTDNVIKKTIEVAQEQSERYAYALLKKMGLMDFEQCAFSILEYMIDGNTYLLKEFWQFTKKSQGEIEEDILKTLKDSYYKASMCMDLFLQNKLVEEVEYKQYKITKKGKELIYYCYRNDIDEINIPVINECFDSVDYYDLYYIKEYPTEIEKVTWKKLYNKWTSYCRVNFPELQNERNLPIDNVIEDKEDIALIWMYIFFTSLKIRNIYPKKWRTTIFIEIDDIINPIGEKIKEKGISIITKINMSYSHFLDISNLAKYTEIEKVEDMVEYAATACAYMIKIREGEKWKYIKN